jgi:hypothetical protein
VSTDSVKHRRVEVGISVFYYHPNLSDFNKGFAQLEENLALSKWSDFKIYYLALPTVIYHLDRKTQISLQAGGSFMERTREDSKSYYFLWMVGGEYRHVPLHWSKYSTALYIAVGAGFVSAKFHRSYENNIGVTESASNFYVNAGAGVSLDVTNRMGVNVDLRYLFVPTKKFDNLNSNLSLKSLMAGIGVFYSL